MKKTLVGVVSLAALLCTAAVPSFTMRVDDNKSPAEWNRMADIFESRHHAGAARRHNPEASRQRRIPRDALAFVV